MTCVHQNIRFGTEYTHKLRSMEDIAKGMALCRLIGYGITDGTQNKILYLGHKIDAERVVDDIELLTTKRPKIVTNRHVLQVHIPVELTKVISDILCPSDRRTSKKSYVFTRVYIRRGLSSVLSERIYSWHVWWRRSDTWSN